MARLLLTILLSLWGISLTLGQFQLDFEEGEPNVRDVNPVRPGKKLRNRIKKKWRDRIYSWHEKAKSTFQPSSLGEMSEMDLETNLVSVEDIDYNSAKRMLPPQNLVFTKRKTFSLSQSAWYVTTLVDIENYWPLFPPVYKLINDVERAAVRLFASGEYYDKMDDPRMKEQVRVVQDFHQKMLHDLIYVANETMK